MIPKAGAPVCDAATKIPFKEIECIFRKEADETSKQSRQLASCLGRIVRHFSCPELFLGDRTKLSLCRHGWLGENLVALFRRKSGRWPHRVRHSCGGLEFFQTSRLVLRSAIEQLCRDADDRTNHCRCNRVTCRACPATLDLHPGHARTPGASGSQYRHYPALADALSSAADLLHRRASAEEVTHVKMAPAHQLFEPIGRAAVVTFTVIRPRRTFHQARVLGLCRHGNQIEVSKLPTGFEVGLHWDCVYKHFAKRMAYRKVKA